MSKKREHSLQEVLHSWMKNNGKERLFEELRIKEEWANLLGDKINEKTLKIIWTEENILMVQLKDPLLRNELNYAKNSIQEKLNKVLPNQKIEKIVFF